jgi:2-oxoglutarate ferredoxin oxidoreductase subunit alpha
MATRELAKGNEALAEAAIRAGCRAFFAYPITPATEVLEYMAVHMPEAGGVFLQSESELAAINMVFGAACAGRRAMTSSSGPGISLMQEAISTMAAAELPAVVVNIMRAAPGLGGVSPSQADYFQATHGGGHGDYHLIVLAPSSVQEMIDLTALAFELADRYRNPASILADGVLGQMMEPVEWPGSFAAAPDKPWATTGAGGRPRNLLLAAPLAPELPAMNRRLAQKYRKIAGTEQRWKIEYGDGARIAVVSFGTAARVSLEAVRSARAKGIPAALVRPVTLWPFPVKAFDGLPEMRGALAVELSNGQMVDDVRLAVNGRVPVRFLGAGGGWLPEPSTVLAEIEALWAEVRR